MAQDPGTENATPWWKGVPAVLTASATFIGSVAALLALFVGPGGGGGGGPKEETQVATPPITTPIEEGTGSTEERTGSTDERTASTEEPIVPINPEFTAERKFATEEDVQELLSYVPASLRSRCKQEPKEEGDYLARFSCDFGGATLYYQLYPHEADALDSFRTSVSLAEAGGKGRARSCVEGDIDRPFVGNWTRPGQSRPGGRQLCYYNSGFTNIYWTESGRPIVGSLISLELKREASWEEAQLAWDNVMG